MSAAMAQSLREAAELIEQHPDLPYPYVTSATAGTVNLQWFLSLDFHRGGLGEKEAAQKILREIGGDWEKTGHADEMWFEQKRGGLVLSVKVSREAVCTRRVVGTEEVLIPAVEAEPEHIEVREVVEWDCLPILADSEVSA